MRQVLLLFLWLFASPYAWGQATNYDSLMRRSGLVDVRSLERSIFVDLKYSSTDNFVGVDMYGSLNTAYLEPNFAKRIAKAQGVLQQRHRGLRLLIYDAARPMSVQKQMYALVAGTPLSIYVAPAKAGGRHNYGVAVDLTLADEQGKPLDMGTAFDHFGKESHTGKEDVLVREGKITTEAKRNRAILRSVMNEVGLRPYDKEWWHYQERIPMSEVRKRYKRLDF